LSIQCFARQANSENEKTDLIAKKKTPVAILQDAENSNFDSKRMKSFYA